MIARRTGLTRLLCGVALAALTSGAAEAAQTCVAGAWRIATRPDDKPVRYQSAHFALRYDEGVLTAEKASVMAQSLETAFSTYVDKVGFWTPYCDTAQKYKINAHVNVGSTTVGSGDGAGRPAIWVPPDAADFPWDLAHELGHAFQFASGGMRDSKYVGLFWESQAEWMTFQLDRFHHTDLAWSEAQINAPHLHYGVTGLRYSSWFFWEYLKNRYGYSVVTDIWSKSPRSTDPARLDVDPFDVLMKNQNWTMEQFNDIFWDYARRNVTFDFKDLDGFSFRDLAYKFYGTYDDRNGSRAQRVTRLDPVDLRTRTFSVPYRWAPERWGYNLVSLAVDPGVSSVTVAFRGVVQDAPATTTFPPYDGVPAVIDPPASGWRWSLVAVSPAGLPRYSPMSRSADATQTFAIRPGDRLYLLVVGAPTIHHRIAWTQPPFTVYRYPWMVRLTGAFPEGYQPKAPTPTPNGHKHPRGGGWVDASATVADTAYVGPRARVLGGTVSGNAKILDHAVVQGGVVTDNAMVGGLSIVGDEVTISGFAKLYTTMDRIFGLTLGGTAQLRGEGEVEDRPTLNAGTYYGYVNPDSSTNPAAGSTQKGEVREVTAVPKYVWR